MSVTNSFQNRVLDSLPGEIDVTKGDLLSPDGYQVAEHLSDPDYDIDIEEAKRVVGKTIWNARTNLYLPLSLPIPVWSAIQRMRKDKKAFETAYERAEHPPSDTTFLQGRDEELSPQFYNFLQGLMNWRSGFANTQSLYNFVDGITLSNQTNTGTSFELAPHDCALQPPMAGAIIEKTAQQYKNHPIGTKLEDFNERNIVMIGTRVDLSRFRRVFARNVNTLTTIPPKHRAGHDDDFEATANIHSEVVDEIATGIRKSPDWHFTVCPEGGFTRNNQVGFQSLMGMSGTEEYHVPIWIHSPEHFLNPDDLEKMVNTRSRVQIFCGEPFRLTAEGAGKRLSEYVLTFRNKLAAVGAPVEEMAWGTMKRRNKQPKTDPAKTGDIMQFTSMIPKGIPSSTVVTEPMKKKKKVA